MSIGSYLFETLMPFSKSIVVVCLTVLSEWICFLVFAMTRFQGRPPAWLIRLVRGKGKTANVGPVADAVLSVSTERGKGKTADDRAVVTLQQILSILLLCGNLILGCFFCPIVLHCLIQMILWTVYICLCFGVSWHSAAFSGSIFCLLLELGKSMFRGGTLAYLLIGLLPATDGKTICLISFFIYLFYLALLMFIFPRRTNRKAAFDCSPLQTAGLLFPLLLYLIIRQFQAGFFINESPRMYLYMECIAIAVAVCAIIVTVTTDDLLRIQTSRNDLLMQQMLSRQQHSIYLQQKEAMDAVNRKYHDLKHYLTVLETQDTAQELKAFAREMKKEISPVETVQETGNETLDVLVSQRIQECQDKEIRFIPYIDGRNLGFMSVIDLCTLFGNAMDNAIEASLKITDPQMREISVKIENYGNLVIFRFINQCRMEIPEDEREGNRKRKETASSERAVKGSVK